MHGRVGKESIWTGAQEMRVMAETQPWYYCLLLFLVHESGLLFEAVEERTGQDCSSSQCNMGLRVVQLPKHYDMCLGPDVHIYIPQRPNLDQFSDTSNLVRFAFAHSRLMLVPIPPHLSPQHDYGVTVLYPYWNRDAHSNDLLSYH